MTKTNDQVSTTSLVMQQNKNKTMSNLEYQTERIELANSLLVGKKVKQVRYASQEELEDMMWDGELIVIEMENGVVFYPSVDHEGNAPGVLLMQEQVSLDGPVLFHQF